MESEKLVTSSISRLFKIGGLVSKVSVSMAGNAIKNVFRSNEKKQESRSAKLIKNAARITETLGKLKGVPMKIGQMLSLHERFLPPEIAPILRTLQQNAPAVPFSSILEMIKIELGKKFNHFESIDPEPYAAASIGQVHKAVLKDGRNVVIKAQYPGIDKVIIADLKNLKSFIKWIFSLFTNTDLEPVWEEVKDRLMEELDYKIEADNIRYMQEICKNNQDVIIPEVIEETSSHHVLCMSFLEGISSERACSDEFPQEMRDKWGCVIFETLMGSFFNHNFVHADPNLANFSFLKDGRVIIYDFGCVKRVPEKLVKQYAKLCLSGIWGFNEELPKILYEMGVKKLNGELIPYELTNEYARVLTKPFNPKENFTYGNDNDIYNQVFELANKHWDELMEIDFPKDVVFIDRTVGGHFGNLNKLNATGHWGKILNKLANEALK